MGVFRLVVFWSHIVLSSSLENLAYNKSATQSSNLHENKWLAGAAIDGNGNQMQTGNSCACTAYYKPTVWWKVDLGNVYAMSNVKIFYRNEGTVFRLTGFKLYVTLEDNFISSSPVYVNNNGEQDRPYTPANFTVTVATYGQYVTLYKDRSSTCTSSSNTNFCALFELCEVEVLGCPKKKYGTDCQSDCPDNCLYDMCAVLDGKCYQCKAGYTGDMCDQPCVAGTYGIGCSQTCSGNCKGGTNCDVTTGICAIGCSDGYQGTYCNKTCSPGSYGSSCLSSCGSCRNNVTCNYVNGSCPTGCGPGVSGQYCRRHTDPFVQNPQKSDSTTAIAAGVGAIVVVIIVVIVVVVLVVRMKHKSKDAERRFSKRISTYLTEDNDNQPGPSYAEVDKSNKTLGIKKNIALGPSALYAEVDKHKKTPRPSKNVTPGPSDLYAEVDKSSNTPKSRIHGGDGVQSGSLYEDVDTKSDKKKKSTKQNGPGRNDNPEGLVYLDVDFLNATQNKTMSIDSEERTEYASLQMQ